MRTCQVTLAIVLRAKPYGESDKIISFLTEKHGKISGIAKGAKRSRRRFVNSLEPFSLVNLRFYERSHGSLAFIQSSDLLLSFPKLLTSLDKISFASYLVEITDGLIGEADQDRLLFQHLRSGLDYLNENHVSLSFLTSFELKLLSLVGYQPLLDHCKRCGKERRDHPSSRWHFSLKDGAILCEPCSRLRKETLPLGAAAVEVLTDLQSKSTLVAARRSLPCSVVREIRSVVVRFIQFHMEREIKSAPFLHRFASI